MSAESRSGDRKCIFVTGGARGIGRAAAKLFVERGWFAGAYDVDEAGLASLAAELGDANCITGVLDVSDKAAFDGAVARYGEATGGRLDLLFNNAGVGGGGWFEDVPYDRAMKILHTNFVGVVNGIYAALPLLRETPDSLCLNTASSAALYGMPRVAMYAASKCAIRGLTEALSVEFHRLGVRAADIAPGVVDTPILDETLDYTSGDRPGVTMRELTTDEGALRLVRAEDVAEMVWEAYGSDRLHWYIPEELEGVDRAKAVSAEGLREQFRKTML